MCQYRVKVKTADDKGAGTDDFIYISLVPNKNSENVNGTGNIRLINKGKGDFERNA